MMSKQLLSLSLLLAGLTTGFAQSTPPASLSAQTSDVAHLMINFEADQGSLSRFYTVTNAPERRERFRKLYSDYLTQVQELNFDKMTTDSRADYLLFQRDLQAELHALTEEEQEVGQIRSWFPFADQIYAVEKLRRRGTVMNAQQLATDLTAINAQIVASRAVVEKAGGPSQALFRRAEGTARGLQQALKSVFTFYDGYDPQFSWWVTKPYRKTDSLLTAYTSLFAKKTKESGRAQDGSGIAGVPVGRDELIRQLQYELIPYSPEELIAIANQEFAWCDRELLRASRDMGFGDNWKAAQEKVKNTYVPIGQQPEMILGLYNESIQFLKTNNLITIPPLAEESWRMNMMSPERQLVAPFFLGGETLLISYPTDAMAHDDKLMSMRGNNPHFSRAVVHHELIAGHHLQFFMNNRYKTYRHFRTPFWTEGWSLYWEMLLWDKQFPKSPEDRIGMLFWRMHRCARIIFSLNYHTGKWSPQQCIDFLVDRVGHERANAEGEVRRSFVGGYPPLYQLAYMTGGFQFYALHKELVDSGKLTDRQFHDAIMQLNAMPVEMIRAILTNQPLTKDFKTNWRFYPLKE